MRAVFLAIYRGYAKVLWFFALVAGIFTFAIMWIIDLNAFSRKILNAPLTGGIEVTQSLLTAAIMLPFACALLRRDHVNTVLLTSALPLSARRTLHAFWMLVGFVIFMFVTYGTFKYALRSYGMNEQVWGANIRFPLWPAKMAISLGALLFAIQALLDFLYALFFKLDPAIDDPVLDSHDRTHNV